MDKLEEKEFYGIVVPGWELQNVLDHEQDNPQGIVFANCFCIQTLYREKKVFYLQIFQTKQVLPVSEITYFHAIILYLHGHHHNKNY